MVMQTSPAFPGPRWYAIPGRVLFFTFLLTLMSFAVVLFLSIVGLVISAAVHGGTPDMRFAYRHVALPAAAASGAVTLVLSLVIEVRHYRQAKTLAGIARLSR